VVVDQSEHAEAPDIEFTLVVQCRLLQIFLHDEGLRLVVIAHGQDLLDFFNRRADRDTVAAVRVLAWFHDPDVVWNDLR